jgi:LysM repeat protein
MYDPSSELRRLLVLRMLVLTSAVAMVFLLLTSAGAGEPISTSTSDQVVATGDTLWEIASEIAEDGADLRRTVALIIELNDLDGGVIHPGQVLTVPAG